MSNFIEQFTKDKGVRDLVKRKTLVSRNTGTTWRYDAHNLKFKITHIKPESNYNYGYSTSIIVNVAVSGGLKGWGWRTDDDGLCNIQRPQDFQSAIARNREIRRLIEKVIVCELRLFGVQSWMVNIGKLNIKESI